MPAVRYPLFVSILLSSGMLCGFAVLSALLVSDSSGLSYYLPGEQFVGPLERLGRALGMSRLSSGGATAFLIAMLLLTGAGYLLAIYVFRRDDRRHSLFIIVGGFVLFSLLMLIMAPVFSRDIYSYIFQGRALSAHGVNPYLATPSGYTSDLVYPLVGWKSTASSYGPLFNSISAVITWAGGGSLTADVLGFKLVAFFSYGGSLCLIYHLAKRLYPGRENLALVIAGWNPLLIIHICGGGHNDALMVLFVLIGFSLLYHERPLWGLAAVTLGVMVKAFAVLALIPFLVLFLRERRDRLALYAGKSAAVILLMAVALYAPYWAGPRIFGPFRKVAGLFSSSSIALVLRNAGGSLLESLGMNSATAASVSGALAKFLLLGLLLIIGTLMIIKIRDLPSMIACTAGIALLFVLTSSYLLPWYLTLAILVAAIPGWNATTGCAVAASLVIAFYKLPPAAAEFIDPLVFTWESYRSTLFLGVPLFVILVIWLFLERKRLIDPRTTC